MKSETGVSIRIPPDNTNSNIIRIEGSPEGVARAKQELIEMVEKMVGSHSSYNHNETLMQLSKSSNVCISFVTF